MCINVLYRYRYYSLNITEFRYKGSNINVLKVLGEYSLQCKRSFVITESDKTGVDCKCVHSSTHLTRRSSQGRQPLQ